MRSKKLLSPYLTPQTFSAEVTIYILEDDPVTVDLVRAVAKSMATRTREYASARAFLRDCGSLRPGCLVLELRTPDLDGLALQRELCSRGITLPIVFLTGQADVASAVKAMRQGAFDVLQKPVTPAVLVESLVRALDADRDNRAIRANQEATRRKLDSLTRRERDVLDQINGGVPNKIIAMNLKIGTRSVELHRAHLMEKMGAASVAHLIRMLAQIGDLSRTS
jgi:two-component system, LuxR family, response regulator FixJ